jgi:hypothetical protein
MSLLLFRLRQRHYTKLNHHAQIVIVDALLDDFAILKL